MESRTVEYQTVVFAALLYDLRRLLQQGVFRGIGDETENTQALSDFIPSLIQSFPQIIDSPVMLSLFQSLDNAPRAVGGLEPAHVYNSHLRPLAYLIDKADTLSFSEGNSDSREHKIGLTPLASVLERVNRVGDEESLRARHHAIPLGLPVYIEKMFPAQFTHYAPEELRSHLTGFAKDLRRLLETKMADSLNKTSFDCVVSHLLGIMYKYTWCLASDGQGYPDVSLYDHLRTTAAIASCLYLYHSEKETFSEDELSKKGIDQFCLAVGDISGIQNYIFDIVSIGVGGGVAKRLRARSLFVQLCCEVASHLILRKLNLPVGIHTIMNSGGRFYLLLPNTNRTSDVINEVQHITSEWFSKELNGELALNLSIVPFGEDDFRAASNGTGGFGSVLKEVNEALNLRKQRRFSDVLRNSDGWMESAFTLNTSYQGKGTCDSCHKFPEDIDRLCVHCNLDKRIGARLPNARYIAFFESGQGDIPIFGYSVSVLDSPPTNTAKEKPYLVMKLNAPTITDLAKFPAVSRYSAKFIARPDGCEICQKEAESSIATFECIGERARGDNLLGFFKADVDCLGETFIFGLKSDKNSVDTISRITAFSRMLDIFFSGWVENLNTQQKDMYTIYSGGDDLFLVGPWDEILEIASHIREDFMKFTNNPTLTLSAGVVIGSHNFPISSAAEEAENALKQSKGGGRNSITILGKTLTWDDWGRVREEWKKLRDSGEKISSAFLYNLLRFAKMWQTYKGGNTLGLRYHPLLAYSVARNIDQRGTPLYYSLAQKILSLHPGNKEHELILDNLGLIASLLIYSKRGGGE